MLNVKLKNHKEWRKLAKKLRRKKFRQKLAKQYELEEKLQIHNFEYQRKVEENCAAEIIKAHTEELLHQDAEEKWIREELLAQKRFREEKRKKELVDAKKEETHLRIQQDLRKRRQLQRERLEQLKIIENEKIAKQNLLMERIRDFVENDLTSLPEELFETANTNPGKNICNFFSKTAACRYGDKCIANHARPGISTIILIRNFYKHILLEQNYHKEYSNSDMCLEYSDAELYENYNNFYEDVVSEIEKLGEIENFRACCNYDLHLRGNVYIQFKNQRDAMRAYLKLQGRFYAKRQLNVEFCSIPSWKVAVCGLSFSERCSKGRYCNFLHLFKNPGNKYNKPLNYDCMDVKYKSIGTPALLSWKDLEKGNEHHDWKWSDDEDLKLTSKRQKNHKHEKKKKKKDRSEKKLYFESEHIKRKTKKRKKSKSRKKEKKKKKLKYELSK